MGVAHGFDAVHDQCGPLDIEPARTVGELKPNLVTARRLDDLGDVPLADRESLGHFAGLPAADGGRAGRGVAAFAVTNSQRVEVRQQVGQPGEEAGVVLLLPRGPGHLGQGRAARETHVLHLPDVWNELGPDVALGTEDMGMVLRFQPSGNRLEVVDFRQRNEPASRPRLTTPGLGVVEVAVRSRRHDHIVTFPGRLQSAADPVHDDGVFRQAALPDLTPADQGLAVRVDELLDTADEVALQLVLILEVLARLAGPARGAPLPMSLVHLVPADVDILARKQTEDLREHVFEEGEGCGLAGAIGVEAGLAGTGELGIRPQGRGRVTGHLDLGNHGDAPLLGIGDDLANVVLGVKTAVQPVGPIGRARFRIESVLNAASPGAYVREFRILLDLDAPAVVVHQVPMEGVHLLQRHGVEQALDLLLREEVAAHVEHQSAPAEARIIFERNAGHTPRPTRELLPLLNRGRQKLPERLDTVEHARRGRAFYDDLLGRHFQRVGLRPMRGQCRVDGQRHGSRPRSRNRSGHRPGGVPRSWG